LKKEIMKKHTIKIESIEVSAICLGTMHFGTVIDTATSPTMTIEKRHWRKALRPFTGSLRLGRSGS
jgi:aryl-alcohol dehydrogenase-like predicted oxidoreductase